MINFSLKKTAIYQAVRWFKNPFFKLAGWWRKISLFLFLSFLFLFIFLLGYPETKSYHSAVLGWSIIFLCLFLFFWQTEFFFNSRLKKPELKAKLIEAAERPEKFNLAGFLSFEAARTVADSLNFCYWKQHSQINSNILFYHLVSNNKKLNFIFFRALLSPGEIKKMTKAYLSIKDTKEWAEGYLKKIRFNWQFKKIIYAEDFQEVILEALSTAQKRGHKRIELSDLLIALAGRDTIFKKILVDYRLKKEDIEHLAAWLDFLEQERIERKRFWEKKNLIKKGSLARDWAAGYAIILDRFSIDLTEAVKRKGLPEIIGHKQEIEAMERVLARNEINNPLIIGEPGSGRKSMIYALANKAVLGQSLPEINYKRIVQLELSNLFAVARSGEEAEELLDNICKEVLRAGNIILVINEFHNFVSTGFKLGAMDISGILSSYLNYPAFRLVAITSFEGLHKNIEENPSLLSLFEKVEVREVSRREILILLENLALTLEYKYKKFTSYPALRDIIDYCEKYWPALAFPEKAMDLLDEAMVYLAQSKDKILLPEHISRLVSEKAEVPVGEIEEKEKEVLLNLEKLMHQRIINQEEAVREVCTALRRARTEVSARSGPIGTFLFLGPTGVGKTETSKALAAIYFGSEEKTIRLDMSEFQDVKDIPRLIGSRGEEGLLTTRVREKPFSLILLDEIEKAHPNILNLFLQVLDEGFITDGLGRKVDFKNSIIIATSNAGYQIIIEALKDQSEWSGVKNKLLDYLFEQAIFRPEFINRFDAMVVFKPLSRENLLSIARLLLERLKKNLKEKEIDFIITETLKEKIVELSYDPTFGARQMKRVIQEKIENVLAQAILSGKIGRGYKIEIDPTEFTIKIV